MKKIINLNVKKFTKLDLKKVIRFIQKSDFTSRTRQTWENNKTMDSPIKNKPKQFTPQPK